jgi:hypothetical protein
MLKKFKERQMIAYKAFNNKLQATMGKGLFQYEEGVVYREKEAKAARTGFHCCENPLDTLTWYPNMDESVFYIVEAGGTVNEDGYLTRISCTEIQLLHKLDMYEFVEESIKYMFMHPLREWSRKVEEEKAVAEKKFAIARGKSPIVKGKAGTVIAVVQEQADSQEIKDFEIYVVGQNGIKEDTWYGINGEEDESEEGGA